ncbi:hypothetical protein HWV62_26266 [Athelia sp. TMB]|nr:hypothetical protein HWV62_26266 [Athelia sp. TMB]
MSETKPPAPDAPKLPAQKSGMRAALEFTGIPPSWLDKRPKLPSRNWMIFLSVTSTVAGYYIYDRRQCSQIRQSYVDRVKHFADEPIHSLDVSRKVTVYGAKWPGDEDHDRAVKYFRKYVKPILVAAAVDFEMIVGKRHGDIADKVEEEIKTQRRIAVGLEPPPPVMPALAKYQPLDVLYRKKLEGGTIIIGRPTFKEFMAGTKRGWTEGLEKVDKEEALARVLESDNHFDEPEEPEMATHVDDGEPIPTPSKLPSSNGLYSPLQLKRPPPPPVPLQTIPTEKNTPPTVLPEMPPILFVPFTNLIGFTRMPLMMWEFFNQRHKVQSGSEAAYRLVMKQTRPIIPPSVSSADFTPSEFTSSEGETTKSEAVRGGDLDFDIEAEKYFKSSLSETVAEIEKYRTKYYKELPAKLETARALARGTREPTKEEAAHPPPTEVELRAERMKKELRWRGDAAGWELVRREAGVAWDDRFAPVMRVFDDSIPESTLN